MDEPLFRTRINSEPPPLSSWVPRWLRELDDTGVLAWHLRHVHLPSVRGKPIR